MLKPGIDDLVFIGFAQSLPTLFPFIECQTRLLGAYLAGAYRPPAPDEMERTIKADEHLYIGHFANRPRHTQQVDYVTYTRNMEKVEIPAGVRRAERLGPITLSQGVHA
jgi:Flavin-binding monooxygenase-like